MRSTMKLIGAMVLMLAMLAAFMPALGLTEIAYAEEEPESIMDQTHNGVSFQPWTDKLAKAQHGEESTASNSLPNQQGNYYLTQDVTISSTWIVSDGTTNFCLNGHGIIMRGSGCVIEISSNTGSTLNLYDCGTTTEHFVELQKWRGMKVDDAKSATPVNSEGDGVVRITGGFITGGNHSNSGGGVAVYGMENGNAFNMNGGTIIGNTANLQSGGVLVSGDKGSFQMTGGSISYNRADNNGGGVYLAFGGTFNMTGGTISNNNAGGDSGGVRVSGQHELLRDTFNMTGGTISNNNAGEDGGGVYIGGSNATFAVSGAPRITGNKTGNADRNVCLGNSNVKITINGSLTGDGNTQRIGVAMDVPGVFTDGLAGNLPQDKTAADFFTSDAKDYYVGTNNNEACLVEKTQETTPNAAFNAVDDAGGTIIGLTANAEYIISGAGLSGDTDITASIGGTYDISSGLTEGTLSIVKKGGATTKDSTAKDIIITKAMAPSDFTIVDCSAAGSNDGKITVNDVSDNVTLEYREENAASWTSITSGSNEIQDLAPEKYYIRVKASGTQLASDSSSAQVVKGVVETPEFSPAAGNYTGAQDVTITCKTDGAKIYYTTENTSPTSASTEYTGPITVSSTTTIKAIAVMAGMKDSEIATATYTITLVEDIVDNLPSRITLNDEEAVNTAVEAYLAQTEAQKEMFSPELKQRLADAEDVINKGKAAAITTKVSGAKNLKGGKVRMQLGDPHYNAVKGKAASGESVLSAQEVTGISGFYVQYSTDKKFKKKVKTKKIKDPAAKTVAIKKLKKGKTYYFRVCTYTKVTNRISAKTGTVNGKWSAKKKVKIIK